MSGGIPSTDIDAFRKVLRASKNIIVIAGAGLSAASGLATFRGNGGYWRRFQATSLATPEAFRANPSRVWQFYHYRRESALRARPNAAHYAIAHFSSPQVRESRCASSSTFTLITQNVDGLSPRALKEVSSSVSIPDETAAHPHIIEMHGKLLEVACTECNHVIWNPKSPICEALAGTEKLLEANVTETDIPLDELPQCEKCGALARPAVVWFGEQPRHLDIIENLAQQADLCLVVGTSSTVYPAAGYADMVQSYGGKVAVFNLERSQGDADADFLFLGPCEETLPVALGVSQEN